MLIITLHNRNANDKPGAVEERVAGHAGVRGSLGEGLADLGRACC